MATTYGSLFFDNGYQVGIVYTTVAPVGTVLKVDPGRPATSASNGLSFRVPSRCRLTDIIADGITSGKCEFLSNGVQTGKQFDVRMVDIALDDRILPFGVTFRPGVDYSILVKETFVD